jgi:hypothetical protein
MPKCPIPRKVADSAPRLVRLGVLARFLGRSERTVRSYCERGKIDKAIPPTTPGGHWHIQLPLSAKAKLQLWKFKNPKLFPGELGQPIGDFDADWTEWLMLALAFQQDVSGGIAPIPYLSDLAEGSGVKERLRVSGKDRIKKAAKWIQREIVKRMGAKKFNDLLLRGWIYQAWRRKGGKSPTASEVRQLMDLSPGDFYRRYPKGTFQEARASVLGESTRDAPKSDKDAVVEFESSQRSTTRPEMI